MLHDTLWRVKVRLGRGLYRERYIIITWNDRGVACDVVTPAPKLAGR